MQWLGFSIIGLGIGILAGLSVSPVLSVILTSLMAAAGTLAAVMGGSAKNKSERHINTRPLTILVLFILIGAGLGIYGRIDWSRRLGLDTRAEALRPPAQADEIIQEWEALGLNKSDVTAQIFATYMTGAEKVIEAQAEQSAPATLATAFNASVQQSDCQKMNNALDSELQNTMKRIRVDAIQDIADKVDTPETLRWLVEVVCHEEEN